MHQVQRFLLSRRRFLTATAAPLPTLPRLLSSSVWNRSVSPGALGAGHQGFAISPDGKIGYVTGSRWRILDLEDAKVIGYIDLLDAATLAISADGELLFAATARNILIVSTREKRVVKTFEHASAPYGCLHVTPGGKAYVPLADSGLAVISLSDFSLRRFPRRAEFPYSFVWPSLRRPDVIYCHSAGFPSRTFSVVNLATDSVERLAPVDIGRVGCLRVNAAEDAAYLGYKLDRWPNIAEGALMALDPATCQTRWSTPVEGGVSDFFIHESRGKLYSVGSNTGMLSEWDPETRSVVSSFRIGGLSGSMDLGLIAADPADSSRVYFGETGWVKRVSLETRAEMMQIPPDDVGRLGMGGLSQYGTTAYIGCTNSPLIYKLDVDAGVLAGSLPAPARPMYFRGCIGGSSIFQVDRELHAFDLETGVLQRKAALPQPWDLEGCRFFGDRMATVGRLSGRTYLLLFDSVTLEHLIGTEVFELRSSSNGVAVSPDGSKLYLCAGERMGTTTLTIFDSRTLETRKSIRIASDQNQGGPQYRGLGSFDEVRRILYLGGFMSVYRIHMDRDELLGQLNSRDVLKVASLPSGVPLCPLEPVLSRDRNRLFVFCNDSSLMLTYDLANERWLPRTVLLPSGCRPPVAVSSDGVFCYCTSGNNDCITRVNVETGDVDIIGPVVGPWSGFLSGDVKHAGSLGSIAVSPGQIVVITGAGIGPPVFASARVGDDGKFPTEVGGTRVLFGGAPAPLLYAYSNRVCAVTPFGVPSGTPTTVQVEYKGQATVPVTKSVARSRLAIFTADNSGSGQASALNDDGSPNSTANPAPRGSIVTVYATGGGLLTPQCPDGQVLSDPPPRCVLPVTAQIGGQDADVQFAGGVPNQVAGLVQAQVRVPMSIELGPRIPIVLRSDGWNSGVVVTIAVK